MAETFLLSRLTSYVVFGSLGNTDRSQAHLSTKSQWVERPSPGTYLLGSELDDKQPQVSMATSISSPKAKGVGVGRRRFCVLKPPYPWAVSHLFKHLALWGRNAEPCLPSSLFMKDSFEKGSLCQQSGAKLNILEPSAQEHTTLFYDCNYLGFLTWKSEDAPVSLSENLHSWAFVCKLVCLARFHLASASVHSSCVCVLTTFTTAKAKWQALTDHWRSECWMRFILTSF